MNPRVRRAAVVALLAIAVAGAAAAAWYVMGEARRTGRLVARLLSARLGVPVTVDAAVVAGSRLRLRGVAVSPEAGTTVVRAQRIDVDGGLLALLAPAGRRLSIVIVSPSVSFPAGGAAGPGTVLDALHGVIRRILEWPGDLVLSVDDAEVRVGEHLYRVSTSGHKTGSVATAVVQMAASRHTGTLTAEIRSEAADAGAIRLHAEVTGDPSQLSGLWLDALPAPTTFTAIVESRLAAGEPLTAAGRLTIAATTTAPVVVDFASSYDARQTRLTVSRYSAVRDPDVRLEGEGELGPSGSGVQLSGTARGELEGSRLDGRAAWETGSGRFEGNVSFLTLDIERVARRLGLGTALASARRVTARVSGVGKGPRPEARLQARAEEVTVPALPRAVMGATLDARLGLATGVDVVRLARVDGATLTVLRGGRTVALVTAASPPSALWPLALTAKAEDLSQLAFALPAVARLSGQSRFAGEVRDSLGLRGVVEVTVPQAEVELGRPVTASDLRTSIPVRWGVAPSSAAGRLTLARVAGAGIIVTDVAGGAELMDGRLVLRDLRYAQAGGRGSGWLEAILGVGPRLRARLDAEGVDLATLLNETGLQIGRVTGRLRYTLTAQFPTSAGYVALLRANSEEGGEVSIDAVQRLLKSAAVQAETSGVLQQTLENLRVFPYETLTAEVRISANDARLDLSLVGRKRLGIFPAPVEAINLRNVPLALLARTFARGNP